MSVAARTQPAMSCHHRVSGGIAWKSSALTIIDCPPACAMERTAGKGSPWRIERQRSPTWRASGSISRDGFGRSPAVTGPSFQPWPPVKIPPVLQIASASVVAGCPSCGDGMNEIGWIFRVKPQWKLPDQRSSLASVATTAPDVRKKTRVELTEKPTSLFSHHVINFRAGYQRHHYVAGLSSSPNTNSPFLIARGRWRTILNIVRINTIATYESCDILSLPEDPAIHRRIIVTLTKECHL
jgi:hypothetical protein